MSEPNVPDAAIDAAWHVLHKVPGWPPYMAHAKDYGDLEALRAADREADAMNRDIIRRVLAAAIPHILNKEARQ